MKEFLIHLFKYNDWATRETLYSIEKAGKSAKSLELASHIIAAQYLWLYRATKQNIFVAPWENYSLEECVEKTTIVTAKWINYLESLKEDELNNIIEYRNSKGDIYKNSIKDIVMQVINHSTYHRAQIAFLIRQDGNKPALTDYIVYQRSILKD